MGKEIRVEGREGNKINGRIYTPGQVKSGICPVKSGTCQVK